MFWRGLGVMLLIVAAGSVVSCDNPRKAALRELETAGIEPSGAALVAAALRRDTRACGWLLTAGVHTGQCDARGRTALRIAVDQRDGRMVKQLLAGGAGVDAATPDQVSVLGAAVAAGDADLVAALAQAGAKADGLVPGGEKALPWAIRQGRLDLVEPMMRAGADPHMKDRHGTPLLHIAMAGGHRELARALIGLGADPGLADAAGEGTLQLALARGWTDLLKPLAAAGADPNAPGATGVAPLFRAVRAGDATLCRLLLECGADTGLADAAGMTPLHHALGARNPELCGILLEKTPPAAATAALAVAARARWPEGMRLLVRAGADINSPDRDGLSPLWRACMDGDRARLGYLLALGAKAQERDRSGRLLVEHAAATGRDGIVKALLDAGAPAGRALQDASARGDLRLVELLLACGVPADGAPGPWLEPPLIPAIRAGNDKLAARLAAHSGSLRRRPQEGQSLLHLAIVTGCHRTVRILLQHGANPNEPLRQPVSEAFIRRVRPGGAVRPFLRYERNLTPLMLAADAGQPETVRHLLAAGANRNTWSRINHFWPISFAAVRGDVRVMRALLGKDPDREERRLVVSLSAQRVTMYGPGGEVLFESKVSTGRKGFATRTGEFAITDKNRTWTSTLYHASMPYFQRLSCSDFGLHQGVVPGYPASHGCIRVPAGKATELFRLTELGDRVQIIP